MFPAGLDHARVDLDLHRPLDRAVAQYLAQHPPVPAADDEHALRRAVCEEGHVGEHLVVDEFVAFGGLHDPVEHHDPPEARIPEYQQVLEIGGALQVDPIDPEFLPIAVGQRLRERRPRLQATTPPPLDRHLGPHGIERAPEDLRREIGPAAAAHEHVEGGKAPLRPRVDGDVGLGEHGDPSHPPPPSPKRCRWMWSKVAPETSIARRIARSMYRASSRWLAPQRSRSTWVPAKTCPSCSVKWSGPPADADPRSGGAGDGGNGVRVIRPPPHRPPGGGVSGTIARAVFTCIDPTPSAAPLSPRRRPPPPPSRASAPAPASASAPPARRGGARGAGRAGPWPPSPGCPGSGPRSASSSISRSSSSVNPASSRSSRAMPIAASPPPRAPRPDREPALHVALELLRFAELLGVGAGELLDPVAAEADMGQLVGENEVDGLLHDRVARLPGVVDHGPEGVAREPFEAPVDPRRPAGSDRRRTPPRRAWWSRGSPRPRPPRGRAASRRPGSGAPRPSTAGPCSSGTPTVRRESPRGCGRPLRALAARPRRCRAGAP